MGLYLNSRDPYTLYLSETKNPYFVDKTLLLGELFPLIEMGKQSICITRPRRFGKTIMANMIGSFFNKGCDAPVFDRLRISADKDYCKHKNCHNVICIDFSKTDEECETYEAYIAPIKDILREDLHTAYPQVSYREGGTVSEDLLRITQATGETFIFVLDEWDYIFHQEYATPRDKAGIGYVDYIFYPKTNLSDDCMILELKVDHPADEAIRQIKDRNYAQRIIGKLGESSPYKGRILAVGISYFKKDPSKKHECRVEVLRDRQG